MKTDLRELTTELAMLLFRCLRRGGMERCDPRAAVLRPERPRGRGVPPVQATRWAGDGDSKRRYGRYNVATSGSNVERCPYSVSRKELEMLVAGTFGRRRWI
jgi:hypothetical protein